VTGLKPSTKYTLTVTAKNAAGSVDKSTSLTTDKLMGTATCIDVKNSSDPAVRVYCDADRPGRNGNEIFSVTSQDDNKQVGWVPNGHTMEAYCKKAGTRIDPYVYNSHDPSTWWIQVNYSGHNYIPYAWFFLDGGDNVNDLPDC
jgi:hypothetical protein